MIGVWYDAPGGDQVLELYEHNQTAYQSAVQLMADTGKAAVIHPTGTGKSIIAFKLIEDHPQKRVCWLSPSSYIVQTQRENVQQLEPNFCDEHVGYYTYARLMNMNLPELEALQPDYIILDEFHRCGAAEWGKGVQSLLACYPKVPVLGLTATNIRYLDGQRDMADELFDGNIASEMSVAEAIATGILPTPKYVIALMSYQAELEKYQRRVNSVRHRNNFDANSRYLEALRRALEMSVGLDEVFRKHIVDKSGKYIVFCSGKEHMDSVLEQIPKWFASIDPNPNIYCVYAEDPGSEQAFVDFKRDASDHLKLLLCIDMLSEGIHVDDISGVILLRPTTSPIVYKQQIGRALAAGKNGTPLIFDVVNNFDSLYSASWLQDEISTISAEYRERGEGERIVEETFRIIDEVRECRELLAQLDESLSAGWEINYRAAKQYFNNHGDLNVPVGYRTESGVQLGIWIGSQRRLYHSKYHGTLTPERIKKLEEIGMIWKSKYESHWENMYQVAEEFYIENGHLRVPVQYVTEDGIRLGRWIRRQCEQREKLSQDKLDQLDAIGMVWVNAWETRYDLAAEFLRSNPDYVLSQSTIIGDFWMGKWLVQQVRALEKGMLQPHQADKMSALVEAHGLTSQSQAQRKWSDQYERAVALGNAYGSYEHWPDTPETQKSLRWVQKQQNKLEKGLLRQDEVLMLQKIGVTQRKKDDPWMQMFHAAETYYRQHGNLEVPVRYTAEDGTRLGMWISAQRSMYSNPPAGKALSDTQIHMLEGIGMVWNAHRKAFENGLCAAQRYYKIHGDLEVPVRYIDESGFPLYQWLCDIRKKKPKLSDEDVRHLDSMQFTWLRNQKKDAQR